MVEQKIGIKIGDLKDDQVMAASIGSDTFAVLKHEGKIHVLDGKCTHHGGPLGEGHLDNGELVCPWHGGMFNIDTGAPDENTPWVTEIKAYKARVDNTTGDIYIER